MYIILLYIIFLNYIFFIVGKKTHNIEFTILTIVKCEVQYWLSTEC